MSVTSNTASVRSPTFQNTLSLPSRRPWLNSVHVCPSLNQISSRFALVYTPQIADGGCRWLRVPWRSTGLPRTARALGGAGARRARRGLPPHPETRSGRDNRTPAAALPARKAAAAAPGRAAARPAGGARTQPLHGRYAAAQGPRRAAPGGRTDARRPEEGWRWELTAGDALRACIFTCAQIHISAAPPRPPETFFLLFDLHRTKGLHLRPCFLTALRIFRRANGTKRCGGLQACLEFPLPGPGAVRRHWQGGNRTTESEPHRLCPSCSGERPAPSVKPVTWHRKDASIGTKHAYRDSAAILQGFLFVGPVSLYLYAGTANGILYIWRVWGYMQSAV